MPGTHRRAKLGSARLLGWGVACALLLLLITLGSTPSSTAAGDEVAADEVRSTLTGEFGFARPTGVAYVPAKRMLLVASTGGDRTRLLRLGPFEDNLGALRLPRISNPSTIAFDPVQGRLTAVDGKKRVTVRAADLGSASPATSRLDIRGLRLDEPQGATFDPKTGAWLILDAGARSIVRAPVADGGEKASRISLRRLGGGRLRGLARNPVDGLLYVAKPQRGLVYAVNNSGRVKKIFNIDEARIRNFRSFVFAPSADRTDAPRTQHLYVADAGGGRSPGRVVELSLRRRIGSSTMIRGRLLRTILTSKLGPPSPDPAGIAYDETTDRLIIADSEVDEMSIYRGANLFVLSRSGALAYTGTTRSYSSEPTGVGFDPNSGVLFTTDDVKDRVFVSSRGADERLGTADDAVTSFSTAAFGSRDPEGVELDPDSRHLFVCDGVGREVYDLDPRNGVFGDGDDTATSFDVGRYGIRNCEGLGTDPQRKTLLVIDDYDRKIFELTRAGKLVRIVDIPVSYTDLWIAGVTVAPTSNPSDSPRAMSYWVTDRHVDNNARPRENDGRIYEVLRP